MKSAVNNNLFFFCHFLKNILSLSLSFVRDQKFLTTKKKIVIITVLYTTNCVFVSATGDHCPVPRLSILTWLEMLNIIPRELPFISTIR